MAVDIVASETPVFDLSSGPITLWTAYDFVGVSLAIVMVSCAAGADAVTGVTINGVSMELGNRTANTGGGYTGMAAYILANPADGDIVATVSAAKERTFGLITFSGNDTTTPCGTWVNSGDAVTDTPVTGTVTGGTSAGMFLNFLCIYNATATISSWNSGQTQQEFSTPLAISTKAGSASTTLGATLSTSTHVNCTGVYINPAAGTLFVPRSLLLGVG